MLNSSLDIGICEKDFWEMTFGEVFRAVDSFMRTHKLKQKENAVNSYILANMIGVSVGIRLGGKGQFPKIEKFYPNLFEEEE